LSARELPHRINLSRLQLQTCGVKIGATTP
jgi:hypothetical protein